MGNFALSSSMLVLILILFMLSTEVCSNLLYSFCPNDTVNYTTNSAFENNLKLVLESLPSKTAAATGFYSTSIGAGADQVYGQALCRGDVTNLLCESCIKNASQEIVKSCKAEEAILWYDVCQVHYSFQNSSLMVYTGKYSDSNKLEKNVSHPEHFNELLAFLMKNISSEAAFVSKLMFGFGEVKINKDDSIYGLVQCTRDLSRSGCQNCLGSALGDLQGCCYSRSGGSVLSRNCNVRFEMYQFYNASSSPLVYPKSSGNKWSSKMVVAVICATALFIAFLIGFIVVYYRRKKWTQNDEERSQRALLYQLASRRGVTVTQDGELATSQEFPFLDLPTIRAATDDFSNSNRLGQGGFGTVYKGVLPDGREVAVKRLSRKSWQGIGELKNEVTLIAKLQHKNLVRVLGCGIEAEEKLLIYEFMPNKSLNFFIFDSEKRLQLDWKTCYDIISGIARGLLYLHEDSRLKIIHRDLKPSNILLDEDMVAKISDFGMARIFGEDQNSANTKRVVGTYGYMAPEYAMGGLFSVKSDVFSFGVIVLEILSGKKNSGFYLTEHAQTLIVYAWRLWKEGKGLELIDPGLMESCLTPEIRKCIHIGLLCVQEDPADRPTMSDVVVALGSETISLPQPKRPAFSVGRVIPLDRSSSGDPSMNQMTISNIEGR